jgi:CheY-like chemotaxis protein
MDLLVIDDNKDITDMICTYMNTKGHNAIGVTDGRNGLQMIKQKKFDIILLDLAMPEFSGYDVIDDLIKNNSLKDNNIVVLTAASITVEDEEKIIQKGVKLCLRKPIDPDELITHLMNLNAIKTSK